MVNFHRSQRGAVLAALGAGVALVVRARYDAAFMVLQSPPEKSVGSRFAGGLSQQQGLRRSGSQGPLTLRAEANSTVAAADAGKGVKESSVSKAEMLRFALPALGIYIADPIMSNIDNSFVGHFGGTRDLAALQPGTVAANNIMFIFSQILSTATTGLVSRAYADPARGAEGARQELARTISFAGVIGVLLTAFYMVATPWVLNRLGTPAELQVAATSYARIRGLVAWAVLMQSVCLSAILATRDSLTPLRVVVIAAVLNFMGDGLFCVWPFHGGVSGAAWATALSTLVGFTFMLRALSKKGIFPKLRLPRLEDAKPVLEYAGPMFVITTTRVVGFTTMGITATSFGTTQLAAYQVLISIFVFFAFFSGPLSQTAQNLLPPLIEAKNTKALRDSSRNIVSIAAIMGGVVSVLSALAVTFGASLFSSDASVLQAIASARSAVVIAAACLVICSVVDGSLTAAKDFRFVVAQQLVVCAMQLWLLYWVRQWKLGIAAVFMTFAVRLVVSMGISVVRVACGWGPLGRVMMPRA
eukprot:TRINITY_DN112335_c0_g1_i1.p1 TRINITY_DN112335_c0_g1~~TRINITY_DN112335_c0_g1_i1.p1  ORF type:complete len:529 (-),score=102.29 TRINITY_DN112335_c0_g1_i1:3-1589(-)